MRGKNDSANLTKPLTTFFGHTKAISSAFFSPLTGDKLATVCYDDKIRMYDLKEHKAEKTPAVQFYHNNNTGRWLSKFQVLLLKKSGSDFIWYSNLLLIISEYLIFLKLNFRLFGIQNVRILF